MKSTKRDPHGFLDGVRVIRSKDLEEQREEAKKRDKMIAELADIEEEHHEIDWGKYSKPGSLEIDGMIF